MERRAVRHRSGRADIERLDSSLASGGPEPERARILNVGCSASITLADSVGTAGTLLALSIEQHSAFHPYERLDHAIAPITLRSPPGPRGLLARAATSHSASGASDRGAGSASAGARSSAGARRGATSGGGR